MVLAGNLANFSAMQQDLYRTGVKIVNVLDDDETNATTLYTYMREQLQTGSVVIGAMIESNWSYALYYGGGTSSSPILPWDATVLGAQRAINTAILHTQFGLPHLNVTTVQQIPQLRNSTAPPFQYVSSDYAGLVIIVGVVLGTALASGLTLTPLLTDTSSGLVRAFVLVGVKMHVYMYVMVIELVLMVGLPLAGAQTIVTILWGLWSASSAFLIFVSSLLFQFQLMCGLVIAAQWGAIPAYKDAAAMAPFLLAFLSLILSAAIVLPGGPLELVDVLTIISPYFGAASYSFRYTRAQAYGGIWQDNFVSTGLLFGMLCQLVSLLVWLGLVYVIGNPKRRRRHDADDVMVPPTTVDNNNSLRFEPLPPHADVVVSIRDAYISFPGSSSSSSRDNDGGSSARCCTRKAPVHVLKGLSMDVCRGEVLGYLGHNGAGKTVSCNAMLGELPLNHGDVTYFFKNTNKPQSISRDNIGNILRKIGYCAQDNVEFGKGVTCREALRLFASLKGCITPTTPGQSLDDAIEAEVNRRVEDLNFPIKSDVDRSIETFSGGMKRKVSIAIALLGDPECVFLDEPTAGMDPLSRRTVWEMILNAKKRRGASFILTSHMMDEVDLLSDRVAIIKDGKLTTCGSSLFLKNHFGVGHHLIFSGATSLDVARMAPGSIPVQQDSKATGISKWSLPHGTEQFFPTLIRALADAGATNVSVDITTLEEVFLAMGKEQYELRQGGTDTTDYVNTTSETLHRIWKPMSANITPLSTWQKLCQVQRVLITIWSRTPGLIYLNLGQPLLFIVAGFLVEHFLQLDITAATGTSQTIPLIPALLNNASASTCFGLQAQLSKHNIYPLIALPTPDTVADLFGGLPVSFGYYGANATLQHSTDVFALQVGEQMLANAAVWGNNNSTNNNTGIHARLISVPTSAAGFRIDFLLLPIFAALGVIGLVMVVLDVLILRATNVFQLFRAVGITQWQTYIGILMYKLVVSFVLPCLLVIILGTSLQTALFGNGGRWLATILTFMLYAWSVSPMAFLAGRAIKADVKGARHWFPFVYMMGISLFYSAYSIARQLVAPDQVSKVEIFGDVFCLVPPFAFQRALNGIMLPSDQFNDPNLTWATVWSWQYRVWYCLIMMLCVGALLWTLLYKLTTKRPSTTTLFAFETRDAPDTTTDPLGVEEERARSVMTTEGINARNLVKTFRNEYKGLHQRFSKTDRPALKTAVAGVSIGIRRNEIYVLIGPNGSGKTSLLEMLAGSTTPDSGEFAILGQVCGANDDVSKVFARNDVAYCPQFDALFANLTVMEHLNFYCTIRGMKWKDVETQHHVDAIINLLGLHKHVDKFSSQLSGGYKRRLSLAISIVGYPKALMVDEVTTGMDPGARHLVWDALKPALLEPDFDLPATLLSTHYMDEAERLGSRIGIMIKGSLATTGSLPRLQQRYCNAFYVEVTLNLDAPADARENVLKAMVGHGWLAEISEVMDYRFKFRVPFDMENVTMQLATIFQVLEESKSKFGIQYYAVFQTNLEQIFIDLARR